MLIRFSKKPITHSYDAR